MIRWFSAVCFGLLAVATSGCGGTDNGRATKPLEDVSATDLGSLPVSCSVTDGLEFQMLQDFELGAVTGGWYFNNDQCDKCQKVIDRIKEINNQFSGRMNVFIDGAPEPAFVDKYGCNDWRLSSSRASAELREATATEYQEELALLMHKLVNGDPDNNVPPNCRAVCEASQLPNAYVKPLPAERIAFEQPSGKVEDQPRCGSRYAMHVKGGPFATWGGSFAVQLGQPGLDASEWDGISFWARVGPESRNPLRVEISDLRNDDKQMVYWKASETGEPKAHPEFVTLAELTPDEFDAPPPKEDGSDEERAAYDRAWCNPKNHHFVCNADSLREDRNGCDKYGANGWMTGTWQFFSINFKSFRQSGWGLPARDWDGNPVEIDTSRLRSLNFMWTTGTWDVWIDDVALYRRKQP